MASTRRADVAMRLPLVLAYPREEAAASLGFSAATFDKMVDDGLMPKPRKARGRLIWDVDDLRIALKTLPRDGERSDDTWADFG
jgi:hypothetical protein